MRSQLTILFFLFSLMTAQTQSNEKFDSIVKSIHPLCKLKDSPCKKLMTISSSNPLDENIQMMKSLAGLNDGHSWVEPTKLDNWLPLRFYVFRDGVYITASDSLNRDIIGSKVLALNDINIKIILESVRPLVSADNEWGYKERAAILISNNDILKYLNASTGTEVELSLIKNGESFKKLVNSTTINHTHYDWMQWGEMYGPVDGMVTHFSDLNRKSRPLHIKYRAPFFTERINDDKVLYIQFNGVQDFGDKTLEWFYFDLFKDIDTDIPEKLIIDLRYNSGGDGSRILPLVHGIIKRDFLNKGNNLYVLTGRKTFSAAVMLVAALKKHTNATFIGEPTGAGYNSYGDTVSFILNDIQSYVSTLYWQLSRYDDASKAIYPDIPVSFTAFDYFSGNDPFLDIAIKGYTPADYIFKHFELPVAHQKFEELVELGKDDEWWVPFEERQFNSLGYHLLYNEKNERALEVFKLNTDWYPKSSNVWDSYGEALLKSGEKQKAKEAYEKSLTLNPLNNNAKSKIIEISKM